MKDFSRLFKKCVTFALKKGFRLEEAQDFGSFMVTSQLEGKRINQRLGLALVDFLRAHGWKSRDGVIRDSYVGRRYDYDEEVLSRLNGLELSPVAPKLEDTLQFESLLIGLEKDERCLLVLKFYWGFTNQEIGYCFDVSPNRINQKSVLIMEKIKDRLKKGST